MRAERPIVLRFLNVLTCLNGFIIIRIVFLFLVKYIASGTLIVHPRGVVFPRVWRSISLFPRSSIKKLMTGEIEKTRNLGFIS